LAVEESELSVSVAYPRRVAWPRVAFAVPIFAVLAFACEAAFYVPYTYLNRDEGWYLLSGRLVFEGRAPYRDFPYFQMPLVPYIFGLPQEFLAPSIDGGRVIAAAFGLASIALVLYIGTRLGGAIAAGIGVAMLLLSPDFMMASTTARAEAIVVPLTLAAVALALARPHGALGLAGPPALLLLATAARLTFLPAFVAMLAFCWWRARPSGREAIAGGGALAALAGALAIPFLLSPPSRVVFNIWTAQADRNGQFLPDPTPLYDTFTQRVWFLQIPADVFFVAIIPAALVVACAYLAWRDGWRIRPPLFGGDAMSNRLAMIAFAVLLWAPFAGFDHQEARYFVPSFALLSLVAADTVVASARGALGASMRLVPALFCALFAAHALFGLALLPQSLDRSDVRQTADAGAFMRDIGRDGNVVTLNPSLALASGMPLPPALTMGQFSFWPAYSDERAVDAGVVNVDRLEALMLDPRTTVIALDDYDLGLIARFQGEAISARPTDPWPFKLFPSLKSQYVVAREVANFGQFAGTLYILVRVSPPRATG
jgi:hypothetical protein